MGNKKRTYEIQVDESGGKLTPVLKYDGKVMGPAEKLIFNKRTDKMKKVDHYLLTFEIEDFGSSRLRFVPGADNVMWAQPGTSCPTSPCAMPSVFWVDEVDEAGEWIKVINVDLVKEDFWFTLNFCEKTITNPTPADYIPLDPGGGNQNEGSAGSDFQSYAMVGTLSGAVAGFASAALMDRSFVAQNVLVCVLVGAALGMIIGFILRDR
jgi:hypothetical protein